MAFVKNHAELLQISDGLLVKSATLLRILLTRSWPSRAGQMVSQETTPFHATLSSFHGTVRHYSRVGDLSRTALLLGATLHDGGPLLYLGGATRITSFRVCRIESMEKYSSRHGDWLSSSIMKITRWKEFLNLGRRSIAARGSRTHRKGG